eukprot:jgi/Tetstr1/448238/TSEL_035526.t1
MQVEVEEEEDEEEKVEVAEVQEEGEEGTDEVLDEKQGGAADAHFNTLVSTTPSDVVPIFCPFVSASASTPLDFFLLILYKLAFVTISAR